MQLNPVLGWYEIEIDLTLSICVILYPTNCERLEQTLKLYHDDSSSSDSETAAMVSVAAVHSQSFPLNFYWIRLFTVSVVRVLKQWICSSDLCMKFVQAGSEKQGWAERWAGWNRDADRGDMRRQTADNRLWCVTKPRPAGATSFWQHGTTVWTENVQFQGSTENFSDMIKSCWMNSKQLYWFLLDWLFSRSQSCPSHCWEHFPQQSDLLNKSGDVFGN